MSCRCTRRRRARCSLRGCPRNGAVLELRATRRARTNGAPLQLQASAEMQVRGRRRGLRRRPRLFFGPALANRSNARTAAGFRGREAIDGCPSGAEAPAGIGANCARVCTLAKYRGPIAGAAGILRFQSACFASGIAVASLRLETQRNCCETQGFRLFHSEEPAKHRIPSARGRQRYARRHNPKPCSPQQ